MSALAFQALSASAPPEEVVPLMAQANIFRACRDDVELVKGGLVELGFPLGLAESVALDDARIGLRMYLLDNSGSMDQLDGTIMQEAGRGRVIMRPCTRWEEICRFAEDHARYNLMVGTPTEFVLLNSVGRTPGAPLQESRDYVRIDRTRGTESAQLKCLNHLLVHNGPRGVTPLTERLEEIGHRIRQESVGLAQSGQLFFLVIATDGLPTSPYSGQSTPADQQRLVDQLRYLCGALPVQLVIRFCTDEKAIVDFYNRIDEELELPLDILDDITSEAKEVAHKNKNDWFAYTPLLHRVREAGTLCRVLDSIDERQLSVQEVRYLAELLSGSTVSLSALSDRAFLNEMQNLVHRAPHVYDALTQAMRPILNIAKLRRAMKVGLLRGYFSKLLPCLF